MRATVKVTSFQQVGEMQRNDSFDFGNFIDALSDEIVILDVRGKIVSTNAAWRDFCLENGGDAGSFYLDTNYFDICNNAVGKGSAEASLVPEGL